MPRKAAANREAKKARRRKRQVRAVDRTPAGVDPEYAEIARAVGEVNSWLVGRGWLLDEDTATDDLLNWVYPPSADDVDPGREPVTRIWIALEEDDHAVVLEFGAVLAGAGDGDGAYLLDPDSLTAQIEALEGYRLGDPRPDLDPLPG